ncbi:rhodanese-related sulfurtransferase [Microbacterium sp. AG1240]|uniref:rhodanese-like domain-containing protein n=1 Tax=Microbacterium sp. AG1240 TaxID=2183992 RepID=UPI000EABF456|nr:rhodanese-like domain-containing protein [Microbacterium sp. AG1240]RKT31194.1 rhodanese-related sulfurtransferase [Microbacterium sp. AG1240]
MTDPAFFATRLAHETDPADVYTDQRAARGFVLVDVRNAEAWRQGRISGAVHLPHAEIASRALDELDPAVPVVVYCWSPGCNGGVRGALAFALLGFTVKEMIGGYEYWVREGYPTEDDDGPLPRIFDPLVTIVRNTRQDRAQAVSTSSVK